MMAESAAGSGPGDPMLARHMADDAACNGALDATRMGRSGNKRKNDRRQGKFQFRVHDDSLPICLLG
jgi:hypothetical protein